MIEPRRRRRRHGARRTSPNRRRRGRSAILVVLALVLAVGAATWARIPRDDLAMLAGGPLRIAAEVPDHVTNGDLTVTLASEPEASVAVHTKQGTVWTSPVGHAFLGAGRGTADAEEDRGYFRLETAHERTWTTQRIETATADRDAIVLTGRLLSDDGDAGPTWRAEITPTDRGAMLEAGLTGDGHPTSLGFWSGRSPNAGVHGFGEQFTDFDLDGRLLPIIVREQGVGRGEQPITLLADVTNHGAGGTDQMTYAAWSSWVTDDLRGVRLDPDLPESHAIAVADLRTADQVGLEVQATRLRAELTAADSPHELIARQLGGIERPELAAWTGKGAIVGIQGGTDTVRETVTSLQQAGTEIAGVWLQDWTGSRTTSFGQRLWWTWQLDEQRYPGWRDLVADLAAQDITVTTYVNPFLVDPAGKKPAPTRNLFAEAAENGHLVTDAAGDPYPVDQGGFDAYLVDLTDEAARDWFAGVIATEVLTGGVRGFMADFAEGLPLDATLAHGDARLLHNRWPALWAQTVREACELAGRPDCVTWFRSGSLGMDAESPLFWNGDQLVTFGAEDGLASVLRGTFSAGVSGWPLVHSDVGGYTSIDAKVKNYVRSPELLARWGELAAFGVVMRTHEGNRPAENTQVVDDEHTRAAFARSTRIFAALADYRAEVVAEATETGVPAIRHGWLEYPGTAAAETDSQFFFGPSILVAPVLTAGTEEVEVALPPGRWRHLLTGEMYDGDARLSVAAPVGTPAAFVEVDDPWADRLSASLEQVGVPTG